MSKHIRIENLGQYIGEKVMVYGIVENIKNHGGLIFVEINDLTDTAEALIIPDMKDAHAIGQKLKKGFLVEISGIVKKGPISIQEGSVPADRKEIEVEGLSIISARGKMANVIKISKGLIPFPSDDHNRTI